MDNLISFALVFAMVTAGIILTYTSLSPMVSRIKIESKVNIMKSSLSSIDSSIDSLVYEGYGAAKKFSINNPNVLIINNETRSMYYKIHSNKDETIHEESGNMLVTNGGNVDCYEEPDDYVIENPHIKFVFYKYGDVNDHVTIDTNYLIKEIVQKDYNAVVQPRTSLSVLSEGTTLTGYDELVESGSNLPECSLKFHMEGERPYDITFTLKSNDDFIIEDIEFSK